jgi:hypothetical protein
MWVRSKYTSELAVLATWVSLLVPWNIVYHGDAPVGGTVVFLRFALFEIQIRQPGVITLNGQRIEANEPLELTYAGTELVGNFFMTSPPGSVLFYDGTLQQASIAWTVGAIAFALAFLLSLALYFRTEQTLAQLPTSEVRMMGLLLGISTLGMAVASGLYYLERSTMGIPIPVGVLVIGALSVVLLQTEEIPDTS